MDLDAATGTDGAFDPAQIALMRETLKIACEQFGPDKVDDGLRKKLAAIILDTTRVGVRDPNVLAKMALQRLTVSAMSKS